MNSLPNIVELTDFFQAFLSNTSTTDELESHDSSVWSRTEKLLVFSVALRLIGGRRDVPLEFSEEKLKELVISRTFTQKRTQDYRKNILSHFFSKTLDRLARQYFKGEKVTSYQKKLVFIYHYFMEYLEQEGGLGSSTRREALLQTLMYDIFKWNNFTKKIDEKVRKRGLGNIWYLKNLLEKSKLLEKELIVFIKRDFEGVIKSRMVGDIERYLYSIAEKYIVDPKSCQHCQGQFLQGPGPAMKISCYKHFHGDKDVLMKI